MKYIYHIGHNLGAWKITNLCLTIQHKVGKQYHHTAGLNTESHVHVHVTIITKSISILLYRNFL